jgi:hypothetical protein
LERLIRPDEDGPLTEQQRQAVLANITACAPSFEAFVYRWWLESTIVMKLHGFDNEPLTEEERRYLAHYQMSSRSEIRREYKERKRRGGVYTITNAQNGKYLIGHAAEIASVRNRFAFAVKTGSGVHPKLQKDWAAFGSQAFVLEVLEELDQKPGQSEVEFLDDLITLEQLWRAKLDPSRGY